jgi:uncharacterized protein (DUF433 family)
MACWRVKNPWDFESLDPFGVIAMTEHQLLERITSDPRICGGRPCLRGMRIRVKDVLDLLAAGASREEILADYPYLEDADISAALAYASQQTDHLILRVA